jgi:hypothetical protein
MIPRYTYIYTSSGRKIDFLSPNVNNFILDDIIVALGRINRFGGHTREEWSVLQHSVFVNLIIEHYRTFDQELRAAAILHDAHEAYVGDIVTPLKNIIGVENSALMKIVSRIDKCIANKFLSKERSVFDADLIKEADIMAMIIEGERFLHPNLTWYKDEGLVAQIKTLDMDLCKERIFPRVLEMSKEDLRNRFIDEVSRGIYSRI